MPDVRTIILVGKKLVALAYDKAAKRPVAVTDCELAAPRVIEFVDCANGNFPFLGHRPFPTSLSCRAATMNDSTIAGMPSTAA